MRGFKQLASPLGAAVFAILVSAPSTFAEERPENGTRSSRAAGLRVERIAPRVDDDSTRAEAARRDRRSDGRPSTNMRSERDENRRSAGVRSDTEVRRPGGVVFRGEAPRAESRRDRRDDRYDRDRDGRVRGRDERERNDRYDRDRNDRDRNGRYDRDRNNRDRHDRYDRGRHDRNRGDYRRDGRHHRRTPYYSTHGRISRVTRHGHGYRVWVHGAPHSFFVPLSHWHRDRFRVGLAIRIGGWYNPSGYYDYYDHRSAGWIRGPVESIDYRRGILVLRNEATGSFVTVDLRDRRHNVRRGDYVEVQGEWTRGGIFRARDLDVLDYGY